MSGPVERLDAASLRSLASSEELLVALRDGQALEALCPSRTIFASAEFLALGYRHDTAVYGTPSLNFGHPEGGMGAEAAWVVRRGRFGEILLRRLDLSGDEGASGELFVVEGEAGCRALPDRVSRLAQRKDGQHLAEIENIPPEAVWVERVFDAARVAERAVERRPSAYADVDPSAGVDAPWRAFDGKRRRKLKRLLVRGEAAGRSAIAGARFFDPLGLQALLARAAALTDTNPKRRAAGCTRARTLTGISMPLSPRPILPAANSIWRCARSTARMPPW